MSVEAEEPECFVCQALTDADDGLVSWARVLVIACLSTRFHFCTEHSALAANVIEHGAVSE